MELQAVFLPPQLLVTWLAQQGTAKHSSGARFPFGIKSMSSGRRQEKGGTTWGLVLQPQSLLQVRG